MYKFEKIRLWEVRFQESRPLSAFPVPHEIVFERQHSPNYHIEERCRKPGFIQIVCTLSGQGTFRYGKAVHPLPPGKGFICAHGDPEAAYYYPGPATDPWDFLWIDFCGETAIRMLEEFASEYGRILTIPVHSGFIRYLQSFRNERRSLQFISAAEGAKIVSDTLALLSDAVSGKAESSRSEELVRSVQKLLGGGAEAALSLQEVAERLHVSREHLSRIFRDRTGMTLHDYMQEERMQFSARLLRDARLPVDVTAERSGYKDAAAFVRAFRRRFGCTPAEYRKRIGNLEGTSEFPLNF